MIHDSAQLDFLDDLLGERKQCIDCGQHKPLEAFHRHTGNKTDGRHAFCAKCAGARVKAWHAKNKDKYRLVCRVCNAEFSNSRRTAKCCSRKCSSAVAAQTAGVRHKHGPQPKVRDCANPDCNNQFDSGGRYWINYCSSDCSDPISTLVNAIEQRNFQLLLEAIKPRVTVDRVTGCWNWNGRLSSGGGRKSFYPSVYFKGRGVQMHRAVLEAKHGKPLGSQHAHHMCANSTCVNPDHLQPVTHRENMAEMLTRKSLTERIRELEAVVRDELSPDHPVLDVIEFR